MVTAFDVAETKQYTLKDDKENPTVWTIGRIDHRLWSELQDTHQHLEVNDLGANAKGSVKFDASKRADDFVRFGLKGWENFTDKAGKVVTFETSSVGTPVGPRQGLTDRLLTAIRPFIGELSSEIERFNGVTKEEEKN